MRPVSATPGPWMRLPPNWAMRKPMPTAIGQQRLIGGALRAQAGNALPEAGNARQSASTGPGGVLPPPKRSTKNLGHVLAVLIGTQVLWGCAPRDPQAHRPQVVAGELPGASVNVTTAVIESAGLQALHARSTDALAQLKTWAAQDKPVAQRELALALLREPITHAEGLAWLARAAKAGDTEAGLEMGEAQRLGRYGLRPDNIAAWPWLAGAAQAGHADAALALARMAKNGDAGPKDSASALRWLQLASERGNAQAMFLLSNAYAHGQGTPVDLPKARQWLEAAADQHFTPALQAYALALEDGSLGLNKNTVLARELFAEAEQERRNHWNAR